MTFKDVAIKNFKAQIKKYLSYFFCSSFSIMIFFMFSTLIFNDILKIKDDNNRISIIFNTSMITVALFSVFFINYAHTAFINSRFREFGVYMTLGMTKKDVRKIILMENVFIIAASLFTGLVSGVIFSRLFQMIVIKLLELDGITYSLNYKSFLITIILFAAIFTIVIGLSRHATRKLEISELLKQARKGGSKTNYSILPGIIGICLIILSFIILYVITNDKSLTGNITFVLLYISVSFLGVYMVIAHLGRTIMALMKKNKKTYYKNILTSTEIYHKFDQNKKVIFILSILSAMIIFFVASAFALKSQSIKISGMSQPNHIEFVSVQGINKISGSELGEVIKSKGISIENQKEVEFLSLEFTSGFDKYDLIHSKPIISQSTYNTLMDSSLSVPKGQAVNIITAWEPGFHGIEPESKISFKYGSNTFDYKVKESIHGKWINGPTAYPSSSGIVLNDEDFAKLKQKVELQSVGTIHIINFNDWRKTEDVVNRLKSKLVELNKQNHVISKYSENLLTMTSRIEVYKSLKQGNSLFTFVSVVMGLLFFIAAGSVLYFKQYTEMSSAKEKFYKLYKLGISEKETVGIISRELRFTFFTPLVLGGILGYSFMYYMNFLVGGGEVVKDFMVSATVIVALYFVFQVFFYLITKRKYTIEILESL